MGNVLTYREPTQSLVHASTVLRKSTQVTFLDLSLVQFLDVSCLGGKKIFLKLEMPTSSAIPKKFCPHRGGEKKESTRLAIPVNF